MYTWLGNQFATLLDTYIVSTVQALMTGLAPVALTAMTLWVVLFGWAVLRGEAPEPVHTFIWKATKMGIVLALSLQSSYYLSTVVDTANSLALGVAVLLQPPGMSPGVVNSPYALLDAFNREANVHAGAILRMSYIVRLDIMLASAVFSLGTIVFLCIALFTVTLAKALLTFVLAVGPVFLLCCAWPPTQRFFDSWLSMLLSVVVLTWFVFFALGLSTFIGQQMFTAIRAGGGFSGNAFNVLSQCGTYCVVMVMLAILCFQAPALAAALTGGAVVQQGMQLVQNLLMLKGLRDANRAARGASAIGGGAIRPGLGISYLAGRAAGAAQRSIAAPVRTAAHRLAALRGRA